MHVFFKINKNAGKNHLIVTQSQIQIIIDFHVLALTYCTAGCFRNCSTAMQSFDQATKVNSHSMTCFLNIHYSCKPESTRHEKGLTIYFWKQLLLHIQQLLMAKRLPKLCTVFTPGPYICKRKHCKLTNTPDLQMCMTRAQKKIIYKLDNVINKKIIFP